MATLSELPPELRLLIWEAVGEIEDLSTLLRLARRTRAEVISVLPAGFVFCGSGKFTELDQLVIVVNGRCSERYWLELEATRARKRYAWSTRDLDSALLRGLKLCQPREMVVEFRAPKGGYHLASLLTMRAKPCDVHKVLDSMKAAAPKSVEIRFREPWPEPRCKNFWVNRLRSEIRLKSIRRAKNRRINCKYRLVKKEHVERRDTHLYYYECFITPNGESLALAERGSRVRSCPQPPADILLPPVS